MTITIAEAMEGADFEGGEAFGDCHYNNLKNHWRANYGGDPCASGGLERVQPGMIISDSYDDRLYHITLVSGCPCSEIVQTCVPVPDDIAVGFGYAFDGSIYYDELTNNEFMIEARNHADVEGITVSLLETNQRFRIRQNGDIISMYLDGTDVWLRWDNGELNLQTDELVDTDTIVNILGKGTGHGILQITGYEDIVFLSALAAGGDALTIDAYQDDVTILTGLLRGAYIQASNGDQDSPAGTIRALELKARAGRPGEVGANIHHLEGLSISADAKAYDVTLVMRGAEFILDGGIGANVTKAVGLRIAQNFQADIATLCYGLELYWDSFEWDADIALASGGLIGGKAGHLRLSNTGVLEIWDATLADRLFMYHDGVDAFISWSDGALNLQTDETDAGTAVHIHGNGIGYGYLRIYDEDDLEYITVFSGTGHGFINTGGTTPGKLYFQRNVPTDILFWETIAAGNPNFRIYGWNTEATATTYASLRMDDVNNEFLIEAQNSAHHEGITINLLETNQRFRVRQNADYMAMYLTATDAYLTWSDGALNLQTDEVDTHSELHVHGNGTGLGRISLFGEDDDEHIEMYVTGTWGRLSVTGVAPGGLRIQDSQNQDIWCWYLIAAGNPDFRIHGYITAGATRRYGQFRMDDVNDEFLVEAENSVNHEGITISLLETNQRFRVRQNADYIAMYLTALDAYLTWSDGALNLQTEEVDANAEIHIHGNGTGYGSLNAYDEDDAEFINVYASGGVGHIRVRGATPLGLILQYAEPQNISCWAGIVAGNPHFYIYGWITAGGAVRYGSFHMHDTYDEFFIETEANANHEGITVSLLEAAQEFRIRGAGGAERFHIDESGILGYMRQGELFQWTYQGDLADDASFTLPAFTDACWGFIQAGANEEYALFSVDDDGDVTLISNSANVVANADTDGKLCIGLAAATEPVEIRNRLDATKNINLIIWYS